MKFLDQAKVYLSSGHGGAGEALDRDHIVLGDFVLFAAGLDDCEHRPLT